MKRQRTDWIDYSKGIGIVLVVYAHLLSSGYNAGLQVPARFFQLSDSIIYSFHMPLFFFLAGLLAENSCVRKGIKGFLLGKIKLLAYPYLVWSFLQAGIELLFSQHSLRGISPADVMAIPYLPWSQFWFLYALLLMYIAYAVLQMLGRSAPAAMAIVAVGLFVYPINTGIMALNGFSTGFFFFAAGALVKVKFVDLETYSIPVWAAPVLFPVLIGSGYHVFTNVISPTRLIDGSHPAYFFCLAVIGVSCCVGLAQFLADRKILPVVKTLGTFSLQIYLVHMLAGVGARVILADFLHIQNPLVHMVTGVGAGLAVPILLYSVSMKVNFPYLFKPGRTEAVA